MKRTVLPILFISVLLASIAGCGDKNPVVQTTEENTLTLDSKSIEVGAEASVFTIAVSTNMEYSVETDAAAEEWLSVASTRAAIRTDTLIVSVARNKERNERRASISILDNDDQSVIETFSVTQKGDEPMKISSIYELNDDVSVPNSHAEEWSHASLEFDFSTLLVLSNEDMLDTAAHNARYPRIKRLANGRYMLMYQQGASAHNIYYALSDDMVEWKNCGYIFDKTDMYRYDGVTNDRALYSSADAIVLRDGTILAFSSFRLYRGYREESLNNGIMMRRSTDNGVTWGPKQIIWRGWNWEPSALELRSGEIHVYFTRSNPIKGDSGTSLLRSFDGGETWSDAGFVARQKSPEAAIDGSGDAVYTDQMPVAVELNDNRGIAVALESRIGSGDNKVYHLSMAYSHDNWKTPVTVGYNENTDYHLSNFILKSGSPYLVQFPSGETVMSFNRSGRFTLCMGDSWSHIDPETAMITFPDGGSWGSLFLNDSHVLLAAFPDSYATVENGERVAHAKIQMGRLVLNHRVNAPYRTPLLDGDNRDWTSVREALFLGSETSTQGVFRFSCDDKYLYCLVERRDGNVASADTFELMFQRGDATGLPLKLTLTPDVVARTVTCDHDGVVCRATILSADDAADHRSGYVVEAAVPLSVFGSRVSKVLFNAVLNEGGVADTFHGLTATNYEKWLPIELGSDSPDEPEVGDNDGGKASGWGKGGESNPW